MQKMWIQVAGKDEESKELSQMQVNEMEEEKMILNLDVKKIKPDKDQPRKTFDEESLKFLAESILGNGLITPIDVDEDYVLIDGERRLRAHKIAGLKTIPCRIVKLKKDKTKRLKRQLIADLQDEGIPSAERYEAIVRLWRLECPNEKPQSASNAEWCKNIGLNPRSFRNAYEYVIDKEQDSNQVKGFSAGSWQYVRSLPKEEREEIKKELKGTDEPMMKIIEQKKEEIKERKTLEELKNKQRIIKKERENEVKIRKSEEAFSELKNRIDNQTRELQKMIVVIKMVRKIKKFYFSKPKEKENFFRFLEGTINQFEKYLNELKKLKDNVEIEIIRE
jgi:hypothetical protein